MVDKSFWPWLAGFWEGEGHLCIDNSKYPQPHLGISQKDRKPLDYIIEQIGIGSICPRAGRVYTYQVQNRPDLMWLLPKLIPHLRFREAEVKRKLSLIKEAYKNSTHRKWTENEVHYLKENYRVKTDVEIAKCLSRTPSAVAQKRFMLNLKNMSLKSGKRLKSHE